MSVKFYTILTELGAAKLANATALGSTLELTHMAVGDGGGVTPTPTASQTALIREHRRALLNSLSVDPANTNQIIAELIIPENVGGWYIREVGLFDKDGILIAVSNCPDTYKPQLSEGSGRTQTVKMILIVSSTAAVTLKIDPSVVLATRKYADDLSSAIEVRMSAALTAHQSSRNHPSATNTEKGFVKLSSAVNSESTSDAATPNAVKLAYDLAAGKLGKDANLSDLTSVPEAIKNLGLIDSIGINQKWQSVTSSRQSGVNYTNTTGRTICAVINTRNLQSQTALASSIIVAGFTMTAGSSTLGEHRIVTAIIPPGAIYSFYPQVTSGYEILELR